MKSKRRRQLVAVAMIMCGCNGAVPSADKQLNVKGTGVPRVSMSQELEPEDAVRVTRQALERYAESTGHRFRPRGKPHVRRDGGHYIVTYPSKHPPGTRGSDIDAGAVIDAHTGEVVTLLTGA